MRLYKLNSCDSYNSYVTEHIVPLNTDYTIHKKLKSKLTFIFKQLKIHNHKVSSHNGDVDINNIVKFLSGDVSLKIFKKPAKDYGGIICILVDISQSMDGDKIKTVRNLVSTLFAVLSNISMIKIKVILYTQSLRCKGKKLAIVNINNLEDCAKINTSCAADGYICTPTHYAINYADEFLKSYRHKKILICVTDGMPTTSGYTNHDELDEQCQMAAITAENHNIQLFGLGIDVDDDCINQFKLIFRDQFVNVTRVPNISNYICRKLDDFCRSVI